MSTCRCCVTFFFRIRIYFDRIQIQRRLLQHLIILFLAIFILWQNSYDILTIVLLIFINSKYQKLKTCCDDALLFWCISVEGLQSWFGDKMVSYLGFHTCNGTMLAGLLRYYCNAACITVQEVITHYM